MAIVRERPFEIADPTIFPASASELHGLGGPMDELYGARRFDQFLVDEGGFGPGLGWLGDLGANCPEGSGRTAAYTGPEGPDGCRCSPGRIWLSGRCQSPQSVAQQAGSGVYQSYASMSVAEQMAQPLSEAAKNYFRMTKHSAACKLVNPDPVPGGPNHPTMMCSIDGGPYVHGAYAINLQPETAIISALRETATAQALQRGVAPSAISSPEMQQQIDAAVRGGQQAHTQTVQQTVAPPPATSSSSGQFQDWDDVAVPPPAPTDTGVPGVMAWNLPGGGTQYEVFGVELPQAVTDSWLGGIPNWLVLAAALGGAYLVVKK